MKLDILAFGAHPDDVELSCAGTLLKHSKEGKKIGVVDLTNGELGTRGTPKIRLSEANASTRILGLSCRENINLADGFFELTRENKLAVIKIIRKYQPEIVLANAPSDRHPDHGRASQLVSESCFLSGLKKISTKISGNEQLEWRPKFVYHYIQDRYIKPDFIVDITPHFEKKMEVILAFKSQFFNPESQEKETPISSKDFLKYIESRSREFGRTINCTYGEGFVTERTPGVDNLFDLL